MKLSVNGGCRVLAWPTSLHHAFLLLQAAEYWQMAFLSLLAIVQGAIVWVGMSAGVVISVKGVVEGSLTVGDAVLFITVMNQLYVPLTYFGSYYRQVCQVILSTQSLLCATTWCVIT